MKVLFVCLGNICRSPLAEVVFADLVRAEGLSGLITTDSAGTSDYHAGGSADPRAIQTAAHHGLELPHRSRHVQVGDFESFDRIIALDSQNSTDLRRLAPSERQRKKISLLRDWDPSGPGDVPDPYYGTLDDFEMVWHLCERSAPRLLADLRRNL